LALGLVKISIVTFYLRVFPQQLFRKFCLAVIGIVVASTLAIALGQAFACTPISDGWQAVSTGRCVDKEALQYSGSIVNLVTDLIIVLMPMKLLWGKSTLQTFVGGIRGLILIWDKQKW
jgi:hypothetical protein